MKVIVKVLVNDKNRLKKKVQFLSILALKFKSCSKLIKIQSRILS